MYYYEVAPIKIFRQNSPSYTFESEQERKVGLLVRITIGKQLTTGVILREVKKPQYATKSIESILAYNPLPPELLETILWMSVYYQTHLATVLQTALPTGLHKTRRKRNQAAKIPSRERTTYLLNPKQATAVAAIDVADSGTIILHGVTASGKTAVYIQLIKNLFEKNRSIILIVPEIALTSQLVSELQNHFENIILTHSQQTEAERHDSWQRVNAHTTGSLLCIGPRSALFLPVANLGLIIIDEAHEPSFKQDKSPKYSALRASSVLAKHHNAKVVQGSATPLITEYYLASATGRPIVELPDKARSNAVKPDISLIDMTKKLNFTQHRFISDSLIAEITKTMVEKKQILIYHNRRGSANTTLCKACGWSALCERCFVPYTLHADKHILECHICANKASVPTSCPECGSTDVIHKGIGTKLLESEIKRLFPDATVARFDGDATTEESLAKRYSEVYDGSIDIIVGTQVVAKGLDLPHLRLVGVVQADAGLMLPDFQSTERTFQLLAQVVGRVGRSHHKTRVIIQTYQPNHPSILYGTDQNYKAFYELVLAERRRSQFPPFTFLLKLTCVYKTEKSVIAHSKKMAEELRKAHKNIVVFGPVPAFYERQADTYRWQIVVKSTTRTVLLEIMSKLPTAHWRADIDPTSLI